MYMIILLTGFMLLACSSTETSEGTESQVEIIKGAVKGENGQEQIRIDTIKIQNPFLDVYIPNPLYNTSTFIYCIKERADITIEILNNKKDRLYRMNTVKNAGEHICYMKAFDFRGRKIPTGDYYIRVEAESNEGKKYMEVVPVSVIE